MFPLPVLVELLPVCPARVEARWFELFLCTSSSLAYFPEAVFKL